MEAQTPSPERLAELLAEAGKAPKIEPRREPERGFHAEPPPGALGILFKQYNGDPLTDEEQAALADYKQRQAAAEARRDALGLVDLGEVMAGGDTAPEMLLDNLLVREKHHLVYGKKESGKTWLLLYAAAALIVRGETVVWIDEEMGRRDMADRLRWMGLDPEAVSEHLVYLEMPMLDGSPESRALWSLLIDLKQPALIVVDAQTEVLATAGLGENSGTDIARWHMWYLALAARMGAATVMIDHTGHDEQERARGSGHKGAQSKVELAVSREKRFSKTSVGVIKVAEKKNTPSAAIPGVQYFELGAEADGGGFTFVFRPTVKPGAEAQSKAETERRDKVLAKLDEHGQLTQNQLVKMTGGNNAGTVKLLGAMVSEGTLAAEPGSNRSVVYSKVGGDHE